MTPNKSDDSIKELTAMVNELVKNSKKLEPPKFPMKFKECLRRVIGGRLHGDRLHIFRKFWCAMLKHYEDIAAIPAEYKTDEWRQNKANEIIEKYTREGVDKITFDNFITTIPQWRKEARIIQRRNAAIKSWTPANRKKRKKSFDRLKKQEK
jgi:hypothetical protein